MNGGLFGALTRTRAPVDPIRMIVRLAFAAGFLAIWMHSGIKQFGFEHLAFAFLLGIAALVAEFHCSKRMTKAFYERSMTGIAGWAFVWVCALGYSMNAWMGVATHGVEKKAGVQKAAYVTQEDNSKRIANLNVQIEALGQRIKLAPQRTADQAQSAIENAKAKPLWKATDNCTDATSKAARKFCDDYASALADASGAKALMTNKTELKAKEEELKALTEGRAKTGEVVTEILADTHFLVTYAGMSEGTARDSQAFLRVILVSVLLSIGGIMLARDEYGAGPHKPWPFWSAIKLALWGRPTADDAIADKLARDGRVTIDDNRGVHMLRAQIRDALGGAKTA